MIYLLLAVEESGGLGGLLWMFLNSPIGLTIVGTLVAMLVTLVFKAKPSWQAVYDEHRALFFDAVRHAEEEIPDDTQNPSAKKADMAFKFLLKLEPKLAAKKPADIQRALSEAHDALKKPGVGPPG